MAVKMVALRRYYHTDESKEYEAGQTFTVQNDRDADRLERARKAKRHVQAAAQRPPQPAAKAAVRTKVMTAEPATPIVSESAPTTETASQQASPETPTIEPTSHRYRRSDLRAED